MSAPIHKGPATFIISTDGIQANEKFNPYVISIKVVDTGQDGNDTCEIYLDDSYGQLALPSPDAELTVALGWENEGGPVAVFSGPLFAVVSHGSREAGRTLMLSCTSGDLTAGGKLKSTLNIHADSMTFEQAAQKFGMAAGLTSVIASGSLASISRNYWSAGNQSFMSWAVKMAKELGATFKVSGGKGIFTPLQSDQSASGVSMATIYCECGEGGNVLVWNIIPIYNRFAFSNFTTNFFDSAAAEWNSVSDSGGGAAIPGSAPILGNQFKMPTSDQAKTQSDANQIYNNMEEKMSGDITIIGEPSAKARNRKHCRRASRCRWNL